jgi:hypothetical protein
MRYFGCYTLYQLLKNKITNKCNTHLLKWIHWLLGRKSQLSTKNKLLLYKTILKPIWTYGIQLWGTASTSNIEILERFQYKVFRMIVDAPWYVPNSLIWRDLSCPTVKEGFRRYSSHYGDRLRTHPNYLAVNLLRLPDNRRLRRFLLIVLSYLLVSLVPYWHTRS